jgi:hypothetical protein
MGTASGPRPSSSPASARSWARSCSCASAIPWDTRGLLGALVIILLGHAVTVANALAIAEIATNRRVEGGG